MEVLSRYSSHFAIGLPLKSVKHGGHHATANSDLFNKRSFNHQMIIVSIEESEGNIMVVRLPHANMLLDPRVIKGDGEFSFSVNGRTLTITRIDATDDDGGWLGFNLRAYLSTEDIPDFTSTVYTHWGLDGEDAPTDTTKVIFHPSVRTIQMMAFAGCRSLVQFLTLSLRLKNMLLLVVIP